MNSRFRRVCVRADGFWLMLKPLAKGSHTLSFGGRQTDARGGNNRMVQDIEYELEVD